MKKKFAAILAMLMILCMSTTVFAASSPSSADAAAEKLSEKVENVTSSDGAKITISKSDGATATSATQEATSKDSSGSVLALMEVTSDKDISKGATLTFYVPGVSKGDNIYILHYTNGKWETIKPVEVGDGYVRAVFTSLSPIAIVKYNPGVKVAATGDAASDSDKQNSTSETSTSGSQSSTSTSDSKNQTSTNTATSSDSDSKSNANAKANASAKVTVVNKTVASKTTGNTSPKTGSSLPVLPLLAVLTLMGIAVCGTKSQRS